MKLETKGSPDPGNGRLGDSCSLSHLGSRPVDSSPCSVVVLSLAISAILSSLWILGGYAGGTSERIETPKSENRSFHFDAVGPETPANEIISSLVSTSAEASAILVHAT